MDPNFYLFIFFFVADWVGSYRVAVTLWYANAVIIFDDQEYVLEYLFFFSIVHFLYFLNMKRNVCS